MNISTEKLSKMLAISLTPMSNEQAPDALALRRHLRWMVNKGKLTRDNSMMIINGSTAEAHSLSSSERKQLLDAAIAEIGSELDVIVGCQHTDINVVVELMQHAKDNAAAYAMVLPPYYYTPCDDAIVKFYAEISKKCDIGIIIYNNVSASGIDMSVDLYKRLLDNANIVGVKECTNNFAKMALVASELSEIMVIISGHGIIYEPYSAVAGVQTFNSTEACFAPHYAKDVWLARQQNDVPRVKVLRDRLLPYFNLVSEISAQGGANGVISLIKYLTDCAGSYMGTGKLPVIPLSFEQKQKADALVKYLSEVNIL